MVKSCAKKSKCSKKRGMFGAQMHAIVPLVSRRPGLFGKRSGRKSKKAKKAKKTKKSVRGRKFGAVAGLGYQGTNFPGTYVDYFGSNVPNVTPSSWYWPVVDGVAQSSLSIMPDTA